MELKDYLENARTEYAQVGFNHRFYVGLRFIIVAFTASFQPALMKFYYDALTVAQTNIRLLREALVAGQETEFYLPTEPHPLSLAVIGLITMLTIIFMEQRTIGLIATVIGRGIELESVMRVGQGQFGKIKDSRGIRLLSYTWSLTIIYGTIMVMWLFLVISNLVALSSY